MGFNLKKLAKIAPFTGAPSALGGIPGVKGFKKLIPGGGGGGPGPDFGFQDPANIAPPPTDLSTPFQAPTRSRRSINDILGDSAFQYSQGPVGPSIEDDSAAYQNFLNAGEAQRSREENRATEGVLGGLQSRGLARSGIALKDIVNQVIGPSAERAQQMASQFGLEQARRRSDLLESERNAARSLNQQRLGGRLGAIMGSDQSDSQYDLANLGGALDMRRQGLQGLQDYSLARLGGAQSERNLSLEQQIRQRQEMEQRRRQRKGGLFGLIGGGIGGYFGGPQGAMAGNQIGQQAGNYF